MPVKRAPGGRLHLLELDVRWPPETFLCWKLEGLARRGLRVSVASRHICNPAAELSGVSLVELPQLGSSPTQTLAAIRRTVARLEPDIVHIEWNHSAVKYHAQFEAWGCAVVISCHGTHINADPHLPGHEGYAQRLPAALQAASAVHCVSASLRQDVLALGTDPAKARVIHQGVDPLLFAPADRPSGANHSRLAVITVGWPRWMKGFEWALQAIRQLIDAGVPASLEILGADAGDETERARLRHTVDDLGLAGQVRLEGSLTSAQVASRLRVSDVLLVPSLQEGLPTVVLEAMACRLPVVATDCGGVSEAVTHGVEGLLVPPRDARALARGLESLWRDPGLAARMGAAGRQTVLSRFTLERQLDAFFDLYREVAVR